MPNPTDTKARSSFHADIPLRAGEPCCWKNHSRNVLREVIGYLDYKASQNPEQRFVWASVDTIVKHCNQYRKEKKKYSKAAVEKALRELRELGIIARVPEMEWQGKLLRGHLVAPHDTSCHAEDGRCRYVAGGLIGPPFDKKPGRRFLSVKFYSPARSGVSGGDKP